MMTGLYFFGELFWIPLKLRSHQTDKIELTE